MSIVRSIKRAIARKRGTAKHASFLARWRQRSNRNAKKSHAYKKRNKVGSD